MSTELTPQRQASADELAQRWINSVLFENLPAFIPANLSVALAVAFLHREAVSGTRMVAWLIVIACVSISRFFIWWGFSRGALRYPASTWLFRFRIGAFLGGCMWGVGGVLMLTTSNPILLASLVTVLGGVCASSALAVGIDRRTALFFVLPASLPTVTLLIYRGGEFPWMMVVLLLALILLTLNSSARTQTMYRENVLLRLESSAHADQRKLSQQRLEQAQSMAHLGSWWYQIGVSKNLIQGSPEIYRIFDIAPGATQRDLFSARVIAEDHPRVQAAFSQACNSGNGYEINYRIMAADGQIRHLHEVVRVERDSNDKLLALFGVTQDVTLQVQSELQLARLALVAQKTSSAILITDPLRRIDWVNPAFEELTGYSLAECRGRHAGRLLQGPDTDPKTVQMMHQALQASRSFDVELLNYHKSGRVYWVHIKVDPVFDAAGELTHFIGVQSDISEFKMLENQLRQSQKMQVVGQLAGGIAHDFNNNLTAMMMSLDLLHGDSSIGLNARQTLNELDEMMQRAAKITAQLLMFARKQTIQMQRLDLNSVLNNLHGMLIRLLGGDIDLRLSTFGNALLVDADHGLIDQAIINLAVNARDAMSGGGKLEIVLDQIKLSEADARLHVDARAGSFARVTVRDNGSGIKSDDLPHIFEPFFTTKEVGKGTGLGLASVHGLMHQHKGWVSVHSELGRGATFRLYFPLADEAQASVREGIAIASKLELPTPTNHLVGNECVLLVEDEPNVRQGCVRMLERMGYKVFSAARGDEGLALFKLHADEIKVVVTDLVMPGEVNGLVLSQKIRQTHNKLPIILVSGHSIEIMQARIHEYDASDLLGIELLAKPFEIKQLIALIRRKLDLVL